MPNEAKNRAVKKWQKENATRITFRLYRNTDADIIDYLETVESKQGVMKRALREFMKKGSE